MLRLNEIKLPVNHTEPDFVNAVIKRLKISEKELIAFQIFKAGYDARKKDNILFVYTVDVETTKEKQIIANLYKYKNVKITPDMEYKFIAQAPKSLTERPIVVGTGPCGLFAGLILAQMGFKPIIIERGKNVKDRSLDTFNFWKKGEFNPNSNVQFGEGGAGTFSDGKLNTQIKDPNHYGRKVLQELVKSGAPDEILYICKPHVGTFRLVKVVENIRNQIISLGGEIRFESKVIDILINENKIDSVILENGEIIKSCHVIFAIGHSARDTFRMLFDRGVCMEAKPFSVGFRIEHSQELIDKGRLGKFAKDERLGAADYKLVHHCSNGRSVYSFCMCPGGRVVAATSENGCVVTNGMSQYTRDEQNANSAIVVGVEPKDYSDGVLGGMEFQEELEKNAYVLGGSDYSAPAQLVGDFLTGKTSGGQGSVRPSYQPGVKFTDLSGAMPEYIITAIREALPQFDKQIKGFAMNDAVLTGVETRTSSPVRIVRNDDYQSVNIEGLYPGGEGAGYAGGIISAAIDGIKIAESVALSILKNPQ
ncbi:MAG: NAD(P)/FAD-dependent oxidoreductase [Candidatus Delongbacteria bacterium]|nr:NAD(P)/FAD-dependent oxidoreductase [Candidatus Delongbacteria bacterium]